MWGRFRESLCAVAFPINASLLILHQREITMVRGKKPSVRYWKSRGGYCCWIGKDQHILAKGADDAPTGKTFLAAPARTDRKASRAEQPVTTGIKASPIEAPVVINGPTLQSVVVPNPLRPSFTEMVQKKAVQLRLF